MRKLMIMFFVCAFVGEVNSQWVQQTSPTNFVSSDVYMVNNNTGYISGAVSSNGTVIKTTNAGLNWEITSLSSSTNEMHCVHFINANTGFTGGRSGALYKTINGGMNWTLLAPGMGNAVIFSISFADQNTGYITGTFGRTRRTTDGGTNWDTVDVPSNNIGVKVMFKNANTGFVKCGATYRTINMGESWHEVNLGGGGIWDFWMLDAQTGFLLNSSPLKLFKTTNGGSTWGVSAATVITGPVENIFFINTNTGYLFGGYFTPPNGPSSYLLKTTNAGSNWFQQDVPRAMYLSGLYFSSPDTGITVGNMGIAATFNGGGGSVGIQGISGSIPENFSLSQNYPNPFNPSTKIEFAIPNSSFIKLAVYDMLGREVSSLVNENLQPGTYEYEFDASDLNSGIYFYKITTEDFSEVKKMILLK